MIGCNHSCRASIMWISFAVLISQLLLPFASGESVCFAKKNLSWSANSSSINLNGRPFDLKGVSYFGFETETHSPHGLWAVSLESLLDFVQQNNFNAIRIPFSVEMVLTNPIATGINCHVNPTLCIVRSLDLMNTVISRCAQRGLFVLLDQHRLNTREISQLWYEEPTYPESRVLQSWDVLLRTVGHHWNVMGLDLKNEPHGNASWGYGRRSTDWNLAAARIINHITTQFPSFKGLFFVEGIDTHANTSQPNHWGHFWGENLEGVRDFPITVDGSVQKRLVYSAHTYGPDVYDMPYFHATDYPSNLPQIWTAHFGFVKFTKQLPLVIGEWGGRYATGSRDRLWQDAFADWLIANCLTSQFYWALNANSGDTGGLVQDDWTTPVYDKLALLSRTQPHPAKARLTNRKVCVQFGRPTNRNCR